MVRTHPPWPAVFRSVLPENINQKPLAAFLPSGRRLASVVELILHGRSETVMSEVFYIGLGDQFDDDRRRVRIASSR
jgi:hypothetical protein